MGSTGQHNVFHDRRADRGVRGLIYSQVIIKFSIMTHLLDVLVNVPDTEAAEDEASYFLTTDEGTMYYARLMSQFEIVSGKTRLLTVEQAAAYGASLPDPQARFIELTEGFTLAAADWQQSRQHLPSPESPGYGAALVASAKADRAVLQAL